MKLTRRGKIVAGIAIALALWGMWEISAHLWYVQGSGYCWGNAERCGL